MPLPVGDQVEAMDEQRVKEAAFRLMGNRDYKLLMEYMKVMGGNLVLSADPSNVGQVQKVLYEYQAILELEAQVEFLASGVKNG